MKIVVLAGGTSTERKVSIVSGTEVCKALRSRGHQAILVDVYFGWEDAPVETAFQDEYDVEKAAEYIRSFNDQVESCIKAEKDFFGPKVMELCKAADVVFMALHGANGEDGKVQAALDLNHIKYTGTGYLSSAMAMDKSITKKMFRVSGVPTPMGAEIFVESPERSIEALGMKFPVVVKTCCGGSSVGVYITRNEEEYEAALKDGFTYEDHLVVEEYIEGREFSVGVVDGKAYPIIEIAPVEGFYDYKNKYSKGAAVETCPAELTKEQTERMQRFAELGCKALDIEGYARLDFMMRENGEMFCLEANTLPGMTPTSLLPQEAAALGIEYPQLCEKLIDISMKKYQ